MNNTSNPTPETYSAIDEAISYFNDTLFGSELPHCMVTFSRQARVRGYFYAESWTSGADRTDEISLNPDCSDRPLKAILSTLVHEMCHMWQRHFGNAPKSAYHNKEWADKMEEIGLMPSSTGDENGVKTGAKMTHYIIEGGHFDVACQELLDKGFTIPWMGVPPENKARAKAKAKSKTKYTCPDCEQNAWAKPGANLMCGECECHMNPEDE